MPYIYTVEDYPAINNIDFRKFEDKWMDLENIILSEVTQSQNNICGIYLTDKLTLGNEHGLAMIQIMNYMKLKRKTKNWMHQS